MGIAIERATEAGFMPKWVWYDHLARYHFAARFVDGKIVVDCACGTGMGASIFLKAGAKQLEGFDTSDEAITSAIKKNDAYKQRANFRVGNAINLPLPDSFADIYISLETIEHIEFDEKYLQEAHRILKPSGLLICSTPNRLILNPGKQLEDKPWNKYHVREYTLPEFITLINKHFTRCDILGLNPNHRQKVSVLNKLGKILPFHGALRLNQFLKLVKSICDKPENHAVTAMKKGYIYEFIVAVCYKT